jgi:hypothetical protein
MLLCLAVLLEIIQHLVYLLKTHNILEMDDENRSKMLFSTNKQGDGQCSEQQSGLVQLIFAM